MTSTHKLSIGIGSLIAVLVLILSTGLASATHIGTGWLSDGAVTSAKIANRTIRSHDIGTEQVGSRIIKSKGITRYNIGTNQVGSRIIHPGIVGTGHMADGAITTAKVAADAVTSAKITDGTVATADLADDAVTAAKVAAGAVGTTEIADDAVTGAKIDSTTIISAAGLNTGAVLGDIGDGNGTPTNEFVGQSVFTRDNGTSLRLRGPCDTTGDGSSDTTCQSYAGVFYHSAYDDTGGTGAKNTRASFGSNEDMDLEFQGSNHIRITAVDDLRGNGRIRLAAEDQIQFHAYGDEGDNAETNNLVGTITSTGLALASGKNLTVTGDIDFSGATSLVIPKGAGLAAAGNCAVVADQGKLHFATTTAGDMTSGIAYVCTSDANADGTHDDFAWEALN